MVSIIIVNYKVEKEVLECISSIFRSKPKVELEIIVVDNDKQSKISLLLKEKFPEVRYVKSPKNIGFGAGNNLGSKFAKGEYLFFLNPDTLVKENSIDTLFKFASNNPKSGMTAPLLLDPSGDIYPNQGSDQYDFASALATSSFINKFFPNNPILKKFFHKNWTKKHTEEFDVVPGTAFMIRKDLFEKIGMFDEKFFLYFEEYDLAIRVRKLGYKNYIVPEAKIVHIWEASTRKRSDINTIFAKSRYLFFKKNYGTLFAILIKFISSLGKYEFILGIILCSSIFLGLFKIGQLMVFIGDQGWFYLSAREMLISHKIPLVGIASSHPWLHQGAFWTYLLAFFLKIFDFDPVSGAYLTVSLGALSVLAIYAVGSILFSKRVGLTASLLYATSPLVIFYMRFPYHTSVIPFFVIPFIYCLYKITQNKLSYLPLVMFFLSILYNFEIATVVLLPVVFIILSYKLFKKEISLKRFFNKKILIWSFFGATTPLLPIILYDVRNGFSQTLKFGAWIVYRVLSIFSLNVESSFSINKITAMINFLIINFTRLFFAASRQVSIVISVALFTWAIFFIYKKRGNSAYNLVFLLFLVPVSTIVFNQVPSDAYLPMLFPISILLVAAFFDYLMGTKKIFVPVIIFVAIMVSSNLYFMFRNNFAFDNSAKTFSLANRISISKQILNMVGSKDYNLKGVGLGSEFESFTMNYEYLTWWLGHGPAKKETDLKIYISESQNGIKVEELIK